MKSKLLFAVSVISSVASLYGIGWHRHHTDRSAWHYMPTETLLLFVMMASVVCVVIYAVAAASGTKGGD